VSYGEVVKGSAIEHYRQPPCSPSLIRHATAPISVPPALGDDRSNWAIAQRSDRQPHALGGDVERRPGENELALRQSAHKKSSGLSTDARGAGERINFSEY